MPLTRQTLFESELLRIAHVVAHPTSTACEDIERTPADTLVLPTTGVFAKHDSPRHYVIANSNHAVFFFADRPYRLSFPDGIGDECLSLYFSKTALASVLSETVAADEFSSAALGTHCLLPPALTIKRSLLCRRLMQGDIEPMEVEEISIALLSTSLITACKEDRRESRAKRNTTLSRRLKLAEVVKEAISTRPENKWTLEVLARIANTSSYHLARIFQEHVGVSIYQYLLRVRLAKGLEEILDANSDLTPIALESGFTSHSHFTATFRSFFGITPSELRRRAAGERSALGKIVMV